MSKVAMPRPRYVAFELKASAPVSRRAFANALKGRARHEGWADADGPHLTRYAFPHGIVRVEHSRAAACRALLTAITWAVDGGQKVELAVRTLSTSGTLKALTGRVGVLAQRAEAVGN
jgi:RNase P/RNase MRP subunit POP5